MPRSPLSFLDPESGPDMTGRSLPKSESAGKGSQAKKELQDFAQLFRQRRGRSARKGWLRPPCGENLVTRVRRQRGNSIISHPAVARHRGFLRGRGLNMRTFCPLHAGTVSGCRLPLWLGVWTEGRPRSLKLRF